MEGADLAVNKNCCLDPLVFFASPILKPDPYNSRVQPSHLYQLFLGKLTFSNPARLCPAQPTEGLSGTEYNERYHYIQPPAGQQVEPDNDFT